MTSISSPAATQAANSAPSGTDVVLMAVLITFLTPLFLTAGGDVRLARAAAAETVVAYKPRHPMDLIAVVHVIGFGLAALGSLSLSMGADLSLSMILRLRGSATSLSRVAEQQRRVLEKAHQTDQAPHGWPTNPVSRDAAEQARYEVRVLDNLRQAQVMVAQANTPITENADRGSEAPCPRPALPTGGLPEQVRAAEPATTLRSAETATSGTSTPGAAAAATFIPKAAPAGASTAGTSVAATATTQTSANNIAEGQTARAAGSRLGAATGSGHTSVEPARPDASDRLPQTATHAQARLSGEQQHRALWADAMTVVAAEYAAEMATLPANERWQAAVRADALGTAAATLMGKAPPPTADPVKSVKLG